MKLAFDVRHQKVGSLVTMILAPGICTVLALASAVSAWLLVAGKKPAPVGSTVKK
jgi:hypothetical protein